MGRYLASLFTCLVLGSLARAGDNWPQWRGPNLNGTVEAPGLPVQWSETENIVWKVPLPSWSGSTPVIWKDRIFLTSPEKSSGEPAPESQPAPAQGGKRRRNARDPGGPTVQLLCLNRADGRTLWVRPLDTGNQFIMKQNMSSPSPMTDGQRVWAMTGTGVLIAFDLDGKELWRRNIQKDYGTFGLKYGYGSSPLLLEDRLIIAVLHGTKTDEPSYLLAINKMTGETLWRTERPTNAPDESPDAYTTPQLLRFAGKEQVVINGGDVVTSHDAATGQELWRVEGLNPEADPMYRIIPSCDVIGDMIFAPTRKKPMLAIKVKEANGKTEAATVWKTDFGPDVPTPVSDGKCLWVVDDRGLFMCYDVQTGKPFYDPPQRLATGTYSASLVLADGRIYATNEKAQTTVLAAEPQFKILATNQLDDSYTLSTMAIVDSQIYMRTSMNLYCIGNK